MKLLWSFGIAFSLFAQSCADSNFLDRTRKDQSVLQGTEVSSSHPLAKSIVLIAQELSVEHGEPIFFGLCTGLVISRRTVLTAAHCLDHGTKKMKVILNSNPRAKFSESQDAFGVVSSEVHPTYRFKKIDETLSTKIQGQTERPVAYKDLALIVVDRDLQMSPSTASISLEKIENPAPRKAVVAGFGKTTALKETQSMDYKTVNGVLKAAEIQLSEGSFAGQEHIVLSQKQRSGVCKGDSGAPLFVFEKNRYKLLAVAIGVTPGVSAIKKFLPSSSDYDECSGFGVYQNIESAKKWITTTRIELEKTALLYQKSILFKNDSFETK